MKVLTNIKSLGSKLFLISLFAFPSLAFASIFQYDPTSRLESLQSTYPGGVEALYFSCTDKFSQKLNYLKNLGVNLSDMDLRDQNYHFLGSCIYGESDFEASRCGVGFSGMSCEPVTLPLDLPTLKRLGGAEPPPAVSSPNLAANFY